MLRAAAFGSFAVAAFGLSPWPFDRAGWAALGFGFLALAVGRRAPGLVSPSAALARRLAQEPGQSQPRNVPPGLDYSDENMKAWREAQRQEHLDDYGYAETPAGEPEPWAGR